MKTINRDAINLLFEKAEELGQEPHESWKCLYFKFSERPERNNHALYSNFIVSPIISLLDSNAGYIYLCDDGDIVVLFQGALKPVVSKLGTHFGDIDSEHFRESGDNMLEVYDLSKEWDAFHSMCETKYYRRIVLAEQKRSRFASVHSYTTGTR